jgi:hypothetical protein
VAVAWLLQNNTSKGRQVVGVREGHCARLSHHGREISFVGRHLTPQQASESVQHRVSDPGWVEAVPGAMTYAMNATRATTAQALIFANRLTQLVPSLF